MTKKGQSKVLKKLKLFSEKTLLVKLRARKERVGERETEELTKRTNENSNILQMLQTYEDKGASVPSLFKKSTQNGQILRGKIKEGVNKNY